MKRYVKDGGEQTFAPVVGFNTGRVCLTIVVRKGYITHQMDVGTAFLNGKIDSDVYVSPPKWLTFRNRNDVLSRTKGLYRVKQTPRSWHEKWKSLMETSRFLALVADKSVYCRDSFWVALYMNDIVILGTDKAETHTVKKELHEHPPVKGLGVLRSFLGVLSTP